ncbi:hypothetical protein A3Q56_03081 [Intoshia linei]|uniref:Aspartate--tRNA ligase, cytoplasmic n=1 Tax=Intoshia linei TaxID=1819745 RepID=A0A177B6U2_9BILA|nr:hypothetical protein A3Q56_03081 [Intoshia linei]
MTEIQEPLSKSAQKKLLKQKLKEEKKAKKKENLKSEIVIKPDVSKGKYGFSPLVTSQFNEKRSEKLLSLADDIEESTDRIRLIARVFNSRGSGKQCFIVARQQMYTIQCLAMASKIVSTDLVKFVAAINLESIVEFIGFIRKTPTPVKCTQANVELHIDEIWVLNSSNPVLPLQLSDAMRSGLNTDKNNSDLPVVNQDTRLDNRVIDLRTPTNQALFRLIAHICKLFREYLDENDFIEIHTPKLISAASEGGANVFKLKYFKNDNAFLAQSPQLYKQMAIAADFEKVYTIGPVFRAEDSNTHRHLTEYIGMDIEMTFQVHYHEVMHFIGRMFEYIFVSLESRCSKYLNIVKEQYNVQKFEFITPTLVLQFPAAIKMLQETGVEIGLLDDLSTTNEKLLGALVKKQRYSNSYDMFMRGEEILSGAQRIHDPEMLKMRAEHHQIDVTTLKQYIESFMYGVKPHAGCGIGMERVLMLYMGLDNIRKTSLFPRDPKRLTP